MRRLLEGLRGHGIKTQLLNPHDTYWDWKLGVHTFGHHPGSGKQGDRDWRLHYQPTPYVDIFRLLQSVNLSEKDVFVDLGSGLGRAVFAASWLGAKRAVGVEIIEDLCVRAQENYRNSRLANRDVEFICTNALNYQHRDTTVLYMFHPFGEDTMRQALRDIRESRTGVAAPPLRIIYKNPVFDFVLGEAGWLTRIAEVKPQLRPFSTIPSYVVSLWQSNL
jgi:SAM-dependent methyltransferase